MHSHSRLFAPIRTTILAPPNPIRTTLTASIIALALSAGCSAPGRFIIRVDQAEILRRVDRRFPIAREKLVFKVVLERPEVRLNPDTDRVEIGLEIVGVVAGVVVGRSRARVSGGVRYQRDGAMFVLTDPRVEQLDLAHMPGRFEEPTRAALNRVAAEVLPAVPLYKLRKDRHRLARAMLKRAWISDGKLHLEMGL